MLFCFQRTEKYRCCGDDGNTAHRIPICVHGEQVKGIVEDEHESQDESRPNGSSRSAKPSFAARPMSSITARTSMATQIGAITQPSSIPWIMSKQRSRKNTAVSRKPAAMRLGNKCEELFDCVMSNHPALYRKFSINCKVPSARHRCSLILCIA